MRNYSVLIIEDDIWFRRVLSKIMEEQGFSIRYQAVTGYEGIALAVEHAPDLILLDILMPELDGEQTLRLLKQIQSVRNIPVIIVSACLDPELVTELIQLGAAEIIGKPFTLATVQSKLEKVFGSENLLKIKQGEEIDTSYFIKDIDYDNEFSVNNMINNEINLENFNETTAQKLKEENITTQISSIVEDKLKIYNEKNNGSAEKIKNILGDLSQK
ncbi:MAG: response regulator [Ignavibacteria bacterium]|nr:response regulator [Ignavibacteria bacterium]